jgi:YcaO-like protein with predicted kinase domain
MNPFSSTTPKLSCPGTQRAIDLHETLERLADLPARIGITRVANVTGLDTIGIPTWLATRPNSRSLSVSQGKGVRQDCARVSAIMESIEQHFAETVDLPLRRSSLRELLERGQHAIDVVRLPRYVRSFTFDTPLLWVEGRELGTDRPVAVPFDLVHVDLSLPLPGDSGCFPIGTNGLASGNCLTEALVHGLWELIERDALALFYATPPEGQSVRRLRLETVEDCVVRELLERFRQARVRVAAWDITSDLGIAAFYCAIVEDSLDPFRRVGRACGFGCHADRGVALARALCEAAQSRLTRIVGSRDDISHHEFREAPSLETIRAQQSEFDSYPEPVRTFGDVPSAQNPTFEADLSWSMERLRIRDLGPVAYVELTPPDFPISVVRVVVPGLEGVPGVPGYVPGPRARSAQAVLS